MVFAIGIIVSDASHMKNRALAFAFINTPYIITAFAGAKAAEGFYQDISWRWGYGTFAIIFPVVAAPIFFILKYNLHKAEKEGIVVGEATSRTVLQNIWHYFVEFDSTYIFLLIRSLNKLLIFFKIYT